MIFNTTIIGARHIASKKPCQDYSISYEENGIIINIVCDGHGGKTYFRSDRGAKLAVEITLEQLKKFVNNTPPELFVNKEFSITAKPQRNPFRDFDGNRVRYEDLTESQQSYALQAKAYLKSRDLCKEQQACINRLLKSIYEEWIKLISKDRKENPFNKEEKETLKDLGIEKAYGCTLLAFVKTNNYWLSFHIGDGTILFCNQEIIWEKPVPEDCSCFLNLTTSLCDSNPIPEFRYAFNGNGTFPFAVILSSDGIDGSLRTDDNMQDFYEQIIRLSIDGDNIVEELTNYLPQLSEKGNKDDISISGYIDLNSVNPDKVRKFLDITKKRREVQRERRNRTIEIEAIKEKIESLKRKKEKLKDENFRKQIELDNLKQEIEKKESDLSNRESKLNSICKEIETLRSTIKEKENDFEKWTNSIKNEMDEIEIQLKSNNKDEFNSQSNILTDNNL